MGSYSQEVCPDAELGIHVPGYESFQGPRDFLLPWEKTGGWAADWVPGNTSPCRHMLVWSFNEARMSTFELDFPALLALRSLKGSEVGVIMGS